MTTPTTAASFVDLNHLPVTADNYPTKQATRAMLHDHAGTAFEVIDGSYDVVYFDPSSRAVVGVIDDGDEVEACLHILVDSEKYPQYDQMSPHTRYREVAKVEEAWESHPELATKWYEKEAEMHELVIKKAIANIEQPPVREPKPSHPSVTITVETEAELEQILAALSEQSEDGVLDFPFEVKRN